MALLLGSSSPTLDQAMEAYAENVELAASYLRERGITMETARSFQLGVVVEPAVGHESFTGRLAVPYRTRAGVKNIKFRAMDGAQPKYLGLPHARPRLFNVNALLVDSPVCAISEGELDAIVLTQASLPAVGAPGASTWQDHFPRLFAGYEQVFIFADGDSAGKDFASRVADDIYSSVIIQMPDGEDVSSFHTKYGAKALLERCGVSDATAI